MAKNKAKAVGKLAESAKESARLRTLRIDGSQNGATLRTRVVRDKTKYNRNLKHKKSLADAGDFPFLWGAYPFHSSVKAQKKSVLHKASFEESAING